jgi:hypothetical protein
MRARREFDAQREFETSTALTVRLDRKISDRSGSPYGAKRRGAHREARECIEGPFDIFLRQHRAPSTRSSGPR